MRTRPEARGKARFVCDTLRGRALDRSHGGWQDEAGPFAEELRSLLDGPSPATLTLYGEDGQAVTSRVWFRVEGPWFEAVVAAADRKLRQLRRDPRCIVLVFEAVRPFRGVQVRGEATIVPDEGARTRLAIASRYLGPDGGRAYADLGQRPPGFVVRLPVSVARAWTLADKLP